MAFISFLDLKMTKIGFPGQNGVKGWFYIEKVKALKT